MKTTTQLIDFGAILNVVNGVASITETTEQTPSVQISSKGNCLIQNVTMITNTDTILSCDNEGIIVKIEHEISGETYNLAGSNLMQSINLPLFTTANRIDKIDVTISGSGLTIDDTLNGTFNVFVLLSIGVAE